MALIAIFPSPVAADLDALTVLPTVNFHDMVLHQNIPENAAFAYIHSVISSDGAGLPVIDEYLDLMKSTGLYDRLTKIFIGALGSVDLLIEKVKDDPKIHIIYASKNTGYYEFPTLHALQDHARQLPPSTPLLYMHTKGVNGREHAADWRKLHTFCLVEHHRVCLDHVFKSGYETCGCQLQGGAGTGYPLHYSGNFFWTLAGHAAKQEDIWALRGGNRMANEMWIVAKVNEGPKERKHYCMWHSYRSMYGHPTPRSDYETYPMLPLRPTGECQPEPNPNPYKDRRRLMSATSSSSSSLRGAGVDAEEEEEEGRWLMDASMTYQELSQ